MRTRVLIALPGLALITYGLVRLVTQTGPARLGEIGAWLAGVLVVHDAVLAPATVLLGAAVARFVPPRARRYLQGTLVAGALVTVIALPLIAREGTQPAAKAILDQDYGRHLAGLLAGIAACGSLLYAVRVLADRRVARSAARKDTNERPPLDHESSTT